MGATDFIWVAAVLHVLSKADCEKFIANANLLLKPGGGLYGWTVGRKEAGDWAPTPDGKQKRYTHSQVRILMLYNNTLYVDDFLCVMVIISLYNVVHSCRLPVLFARCMLWGRLCCTQLATACSVCKMHALEAFMLHTAVQCLSCLQDACFGGVYVAHSCPLPVLFARCMLGRRLRCTRDCTITGLSSELTLKKLLL